MQNPYNLLNRTFEIGNAEIAIREQVGLLAYSPLAFGALSGKYLGGANPPGTRLTLWDRFSRYKGAGPEAAIAAYVEVARKYGLAPAQLALAYVNAQPFVTSNLIGATSLEQLATNIASVDIRLPREAIDEIEAIHARAPNLCP